MNIIGKSECTASQMAQYLIGKNPSAKPWALEYAKLYIEEGEAEGVRGDGAWYQSCKETGNFKFDSGTAVTFDQNNFCGLGVTKKGMKGHSFETPRLGIRAQIQHLKAYATTAPLKNPCIDPRYKYVSKGCAPRFEDLAGKWAVPGYNTNLASSLEDAMAKGIGYGFDIIAGINKMKSLVVTDPSLKNEEDDKMEYSNSSLVSYTNISPNKTSPRTHKIDTITIHCIVGQWTAKQGCDYFAKSTAQASANYVVGKDGSIGLCVEEKDRSWCSSNAANDHRAITIEVASDTTSPYAVTDKALSTLIKLCADICKRNGIKKLLWKGDKSLIGQINKQNMTVHRWFKNKACPGDYLYERHGYIADEVNKMLGTSSAVSAPTVLQNLYRVRKLWADSASQTGAYASLENAKKNCKSGYSVFDKDGNVVYSNIPTPSTKMFHRVQTGAYKNKSGAIALQNKLKASGFNAIIKEVNGLHKVQIGAYSDVKNAEAMLKKVKAKGYSAFISYS